ncbi:MAG: hypothetical protein RLO01_01845 [Thalassobaculaceae bacterium]
MDTEYLSTLVRVIPADSEVVANVTGDFLTFTSATSSLFDIAIGDQSSWVPFDAGVRYRLPVGVQFNKVRLRDRSGATNTVLMYYGFGEFRDNRVTLAGGVRADVPGRLEDVADVSLAAGATTLIAAADTLRREIIITNLSSTETLRIGSASAGAARGTPLLPNGTLVLETAAAVYGYNPGAGAVLVAVNSTEFAS